jgi:hypothetical protein
MFSQLNTEPEETTPAFTIALKLLSKKELVEEQML